MSRLRRARSASRSKPNLKAVREGRKAKAKGQQERWTKAKPARRIFMVRHGFRVELGGNERVVPLDPVRYERVEPRLFGVVPTFGALALGSATLVAVLVSFVFGHWLLGLALLVPALGLFALFVETARRFRPTDPASRAAMSMGERLRDWSGFAAGSAGAWSRAGRELLAARRELADIHSEFRRAQLELGGAAYREDQVEIEQLRRQMHELEKHARELGPRTHRALEEARRRVGEERIAIQPTEVVRTDTEPPTSPD